MMPSSVNRVSRFAAGPEKRLLTWENPVSEGGLEHPFEWYITETVIYHHYKLT